VLTLTTAQQTAFVNALLSLKAKGKYDAYVTTHASAMMHITPAPGDPPADPSDPMAQMMYRNAAHSGPAFFPWHRELVLRLENDLSVEMAEPDFAMPYWNWAADSALTPGTSPIWSPTLMGGDGDSTKSNQVTTGPFRSVASGGTWTTVEEDPDTGAPLPASFLTRTLGRGTALLAGSIKTLPTPANVTATQALTPYDTPDFSSSTKVTGYRNAAEGWNPYGMHNLIHVWVGGSMEPATSPNDPVFFLHHCNVDRLWNLWQTAKAGGFGKGYVPVSGGPVGHNLTDALFPWNTAADTRTPADLVNSLTLGYKYDTD
jgi:tyrosinase